MLQVLKDRVDKKNQCFSLLFVLNFGTLAEAVLSFFNAVTCSSDNSHFKEERPERRSSLRSAMLRARSALEGIVTQVESSRATN